MMINTMTNLFASIFDRDEILEWARETGAVKRLRDIHPADLALALVHCAIGDETRSIATARRALFDLTKYMPEESSFYNRLNSGLPMLMKRLFERALAAGTLEQRKVLAAALEGSGILDIEAIDGSQITLPASASMRFPSTNEFHGGVKLTASLSVLFQNITSVTLTDARTHDRKALKLPRWLHGRLCLIDRGYADHSLWATIEDRHGFFLTPLKSSTTPRIREIRSGVSTKHIGNPLSGELSYWNEVDVDADFYVRKRGRRTFRVVAIPVSKNLSDGTVETTSLWFVTNLPPELFSAQQIATIYRLRWEVEQLFRTLKMVGRLDHLRSANPNVIHAFIYATLLGMALSHNICTLMRRARPDCEPSQFRVTALVLRSLPEIIAAVGSERMQSVLEDFEHALWREGTNPNPGRPYRSVRYAQELLNVA